MSSLTTCDAPIDKAPGIFGFIPEAKFWPHVDKTGDCWIWTRFTNNSGYGQVGRSRAAHRVAWELTNGPIPAGMCVLHRCDNPPCVRPSHLFLGTQRDNIADMLAKGRGVVPKPRYGYGLKGSLSGRAKLTEADVLALRAEYARGKVSIQVLADRFAVNNKTMWNAVSGRTWRHV